MTFHIELYTDGKWVQRDWTADRFWAYRLLTQCMAQWTSATRGRIVTSKGEVITSRGR